MAPAREERRLAAILAADMVSYSRLMEADESGTIARQRAHRDEVIDPSIAEHRGRIVKTTGDGLLVEFASAVDAVACAVAVQRAIAVREADAPTDTRIAYRIGVNIGDVVIDGDDILGDGVNVAARMEGLAPPGGICVSAKVFDEVRNKLDLGFADLGPLQVKNITEPIRSYRVLLDESDAGSLIAQKPQTSGRRWWLGVAAAAAVGIVVAGVLWWRPWVAGVAPARAAQMAYPLPKKPSIAVLPFRNLSADKTQAFLAEGLSESIVSALSRISEMFVIARRSTLAYRGKDVKIRRVAEELGVRYVLKGSVQRAGQRLRVTAQLIDAIEGAYRWTGRFDRDVKDLFKVQDEITARIVTSLRVRLTEGKQARVRTTGAPVKFKAWELRIKGVANYRKFNKQANLRARRYFQEAVKIDPRFTGAWGWIAWTHWSDVRFLWSKDSVASIAAGKAAARKGIRLDPTDGGAHSALGSMYYLEKDLARGVPLIRKAVEINPNFADTIALLAGGLTYTGGERESLVLMKRAMRLAPGYPAWYLVVLCRAQRLTNQIKNAIDSCTAAAKRAPRANFFQVELVVTLIAGGKLAEARKTAALVMRNDPKFTVSRWGKFVNYTNPVIQKRFLDALRTAGLPEWAPLPLPKQPSIAVLPFKNLSGDRGQEFIADGLTENIISALSKASQIFVIARTSTFVYKGKSVSARRVAKTLGVRYVLEGSFQKSGGNIRVITRLIDSVSGRTVWSERYDRKLSDLFAVQDEITRRIVVSLHVKLTEGEQARIRSKLSTNITAWELSQRALRHYRRYNKHDNARAQKLAKESVRLDPRNLLGWTILAWSHWADARFQFTDNKEASLEAAAAAARKALALDDKDIDGLMLLGAVRLMRRDYDGAVEAVRQAVALSPNFADAIANLGFFLTYAGKPKESIALMKRAMRLAPYHPSWYPLVLGRAYRLTGHFGKAIAALRTAVQRTPKAFPFQLELAATLSEAGQLDKARAVAAKALRLNPKFTVSKWAKTVSYKDLKVQRRFLDNLRRAGLPE